MKIINVFEAKTRLSEILEQVAKGEEVILGKHGRPVAILSPYRNKASKRKLGTLKGQYKMSEDFDEPLPPEFFNGSDETAA
jgi:prevent-host-death family protein